MIFLGIIIGAILIYLILRPKLRQTQKLDQATQEKNTQFRLELTELTAQLNIQRESLSSIAALLAEKQQTLQTSEELIKTKEQEWLRAYQEEYINSLKDYAFEYRAQTQEKKEKMAQLNAALQRLKSVVDAANEENKRAQSEAQQKNFYRLQISDLDIQEIKKIREIAPYLRDTTPLNKVI